MTTAITTDRDRRPKRGRDDVECGDEATTNRGDRKRQQLTTTLKTDARQSMLARRQAHDNYAFLGLPGFNRSMALRSLRGDALTLFDFWIPLMPQHIADVRNMAQRTAAWKWIRQARTSSSHADAAVGQSDMAMPIKTAYDDVYGSSHSNVATRFGTNNERAALQDYIDSLDALVCRVFREQLEHHRASNPSTKMTHFTFRNERFPVDADESLPLVSAHQNGSLIDPWNHWRITSLDAIITINGIVCGIVEAKCSFGEWSSNPEMTAEPYDSMRPKHYTQIQHHLYIGRLHYPRIQWCDIIVWTPMWGFWITTFVLVLPYYLQWFAPREMRYSFQLLLPGFVERVQCVAKRTHHGPLAFVAALQDVFAEPAEDDASDE